MGINHDILVKMIAAQPNTLAGTRNRALLSLGYDFLARRSELEAIRSNDLKSTRDGALKGMIRKSKTDQYGKGRLVFGSERSAELVKKWLRLKFKPYSTRLITGGVWTEPSASETFTKSSSAA